MYYYICFAALFIATCNGQAESLPRSIFCETRNGYVKVNASCDAYLECRDYQSTDMTCPDGLHYNPNAIWPAYPCGYPMDVPCVGRGAIQPAQPTADCPHQYGFFPHPNATADNCGQYRMCVSGRAIDMMCPPGLAFNAAIGRCDWPDLVTSCNTDNFLGFKCPVVPLDATGKPVDIVRNYKYEGNCYYFFSCERGRPRLLSCDAGMAFDTASSRCIDSDRVICEDSLEIK